MSVEVGFNLKMLNGKDSLIKIISWSVIFQIQFEWLLLWKK